MRGGSCPCPGWEGGGEGSGDHPLLGSGRGWELVWLAGIESLPLTVVGIEDELVEERRARALDLNADRLIEDELVELALAWDQSDRVDCDLVGVERVEVGTPRGVAWEGIQGR